MPSSSCAWCKRTITQPRAGRPRMYCSARCKQAAYEERRLAAAMETGKQQAIEELAKRTPPVLR